jgi:predicted nuclease with TOPRIM domain
MPWWTWIAIAFFAAAFVIGVGVAVAGIRRLRELQSRAEAMTAAFEELMAKAEALEQRAMTVEENRARLESHLARLGRSREKLGVLTWALRDATRDLTSFRKTLRK